MTNNTHDDFSYGGVSTPEQLLWVAEMERQMRRLAAREDVNPCLCVSSNDPRPWQVDEAVALALPGEARTVSIDYCIADQVQALWAAGIGTQGSCCGHGSEPPSVVLTTMHDALRAAEVLGEADGGRSWAILAWVLGQVARS